MPMNHSGWPEGRFTNHSPLQTKGVWEVCTVRGAQARLLLLPDKGPASQQDSSWEELGEELLPSCLLSPTSAKGAKSHPLLTPLQPPYLLPSHPCSPYISSPRTPAAPTFQGSKKNPGPGGK